MSLESVVRPFETPTFAPPRRIIKAGDVSGDNVVITVHGGTSGKTFTTSYTYALKRYMTKQIKEKTEINPNDDPFNANNDPFNPNAGPP
jgi:hypothetical protein